MRKAGLCTTDSWLGLLVGGAMRVGRRLLMARRFLPAERGQPPADLPHPLAVPDTGLKRTQEAPSPGAMLGRDPAGRWLLGPYLIEKKLGQGAMGAVYLGRDAQHDRPVAIKTMALSQAFDADELAEAKERFLREAETAGRLKHPNIVAIYGAGEVHDLAYIAMEFIQGRDLLPYTLPGQLLPLAQVVSIVARVADALAYAHSQNVVHRDVKPANVMYEPGSDQLKVTDFGIARLTDSSKTRVGMVLGTPSYMSPEQLSGKKIDGRSDLFSLGVTLYQMVCGELPFVGDSMARLMFRIVNEVPPAVREKNPQVPDALAAVIDRAMAKDLAQRYQSGGDLARELRACLTAAPQEVGRQDG